jgi:DNA-binding transcriptional ArsR family regulator
MPDDAQLARMCKVLSVDTRVRMVRLLTGRSLCVNALARRLLVTPAAVSQHLRVLRDADLVRAERQGNFVHYRANPEALARWGEALRGLLVLERRSGEGDTG